MSLPVIYLARHGETAWTLSGQHTGLTDLPLTEHGEENAKHLGERLQGLAFAKVFTSPLQRARRTCELAGFGAVAEIDPDLVEWNYGEYEGLAPARRFTKRIHTGSLSRLLPRRRVSGADRDAGGSRCGTFARDSRQCVAVFQWTLLRVLASRWLGLDASAGQYLLLSTAALSELGHEHDRSGTRHSIVGETTRVTCRGDISCPRHSGFLFTLSHL